VAAVAAGSLLLMLGTTACGSSKGSSSEPVTETSSSTAEAVQSSAAARPVVHSSAAARPVVHSLAAARSIVNSLWSQRESALASLDAAELDRFESAFAKQQDTAYINSVRCRCEPPKDPHLADRVIPQIPKTSVQPVFFAEVHTTSARTGERAWYVVAVARDGAGVWKLVHINFGGYHAAPPLRSLTNSDGYTPEVSAAVRSRIRHLVEASMRYTTTHNVLTHHTDYGATIRSRYQLDPERDGIYGLALPSGKVLACLGFHRIDTYSLASGLQQGPARTQWGHLLRPGIYTSIRVDNAAPVCAIGRGVGETTGAVRFKYDERVIATTGVPA
jgi:hypothetical protein